MDLRNADNFLECSFIRGWTEDTQQQKKIASAAIEVPKLSLKLRAFGKPKKNDPIKIRINVLEAKDSKTDELFNSLDASSSASALGANPALLAAAPSSRASSTTPSLGRLQIASRAASVASKPASGITTPLSAAESDSAESLLDLPEKVLETIEQQPIKQEKLSSWQTMVRTSFLN